MLATHRPMGSAVVGRGTQVGWGGNSVDNVPRPPRLRLWLLLRFFAKAGMSGTPGQSLQVKDKPIRRSSCDGRTQAGRANLRIVLRQEVFHRYIPLIIASFSRRHFFDDADDIVARGCTIFGSPRADTKRTGRVGDAVGWPASGWKKGDGRAVNGTAIEPHLTRHGHRQRSPCTAAEKPERKHQHNGFQHDVMARDRAAGRPADRPGVGRGCSR